MVAGTGRFTTDFLEAGRGRWIGKEGAEGVYAVGLAPSSGRRAVGIAFKIEDGSARPRDAVTLDILSRLGRLPLGDTASARRVRRAACPQRARPRRGAHRGRRPARRPFARRRGKT